MGRGRVIAALVAVTVLTLTTPAHAATPLFRLTDQRLDEASGLAVGVRSPGVLYAQNDSGDTARFFALDAVTGRVRGEYDVPGARNVDWEDIAAAPDARGVPSVWLADIGDNDNNRAEVQVYRVDEPSVGTDGGMHTTSAPEVWHLRYPDGPHNAEAILVDPRQHRFFIATKDFFGHSVVYAAPATPGGTAPQTMTRIGALDLRTTGTPGGPNVVGQVTVTAGSVSADASLMVLRTYTDAYLWRLDDAGVAGALRRKPVRVALPAQPLGEGVCFQRSGTAWRLLTDSEQVGSAVYAVAVPALPARRTPTPSSPMEDQDAVSARQSARPLWIPITGAAAALVALFALAYGIGLWRGRSSKG